MNLHRIRSALIVVVAAVWLAACQSVPPQEPPPPAGKPSLDFLPADWADLPDWMAQELPASWPALQQSCSALRLKTNWLPICAAAKDIAPDDAMAQRTFYETWFTPYKVLKDRKSTRLNSSH